MSQCIRVLYVDDSPYDRSLVRHALEHAETPFELVEATTRDEFVACLNDGPYDVVLSDFDILGYKGAEVVEEVGQRLPNVPVIVVTGSGSEKIAIDVMKRGAFDYVVKSPAHLQRLPHIINAVLNQWRLREEKRKSAEERAYLAQLLEQVADAVISTDLEFRIRSWNPAAEQLYGWSEQEALGQPLPALLPPRFPDECGAVYDAAALLERRRWQGEVVQQRKDGQEIRAQISTAVRNDSEGNPIGFVSIVRDITERARRNRWQDTQFRVTRTIADASAMEDLAAPALEQLCEGLGWRLGEMWLRQPASDTFQLAAAYGQAERPAMQHFIQRAQKRALHFGEAVPDQICAPNASRWLGDVSSDPLYKRQEAAREAGLRSACFAPISDGDTVFGALALYTTETRERDDQLAFILSDIGLQIGQFAARTQAELALQASQKRYMELLDSIDGVVWEADPASLQFWFVSAQAERLTGYPVERWLEEPEFWKRYIHPGDIDRVIAHAIQCVQDRRPYEIEYRITTADGRRRWLRDSVTLVVESGKGVLLRGLTVDITARKAAEDALAERVRELTALRRIQALLDRRDMAVGAMLREIAHCIPSAFQAPELVSLRISWGDVVVESTLEGESSGRLTETFSAGSAEGEIRVEYVPGHREEAPPFLGEERNFLRTVARSIETHLSRREAEQRFVEERDFAQSVTNNLPGIVCLLDKTGRLIRWNANAPEFTGYSDKDLHNQPYTAFIDERDWEYAENLRQSALGGTPVSFELRLIDHAGESWPFYFNGALITLGGVEYLLIVGVDIRERKQAEQALRESEERFRLLFEDSPVSIMVHDKDSGAILDANMMALRSYGYSSMAEFEKGDLWLEPPYSFTEALENIRRVYSEGPQKFQWLSRHSSGELFWEDVRLTPITIDGRPCVLAASVNITERKHTEDALRQSEERFRKLFDDSPLSIIVFDKDTGEILDANRTAVQINGCASLDELQRNEFWAEPPYSFENGLAIMQKVYAKGAMQFEWLSRHPSGEPLWQEVHLTPITIAEKQCILSCSVDITERKLAEEKLRLLRAAVEHSQDAMVVTDTRVHDPGPYIVSVNPAFERITGYSREEVIGQPIRILRGEKTDIALVQGLREKWARGEQTVAETINYRKDGAPFTIEWSVNPIRGVDGAITHYVAILRDVTERRAIEEQMRSSIKLEAIGRLAGGVAHDFNNLLSVILGYGEMIASSLHEKDPILAEAQGIIEASQRAASLTRQLLAFSRKQVLEPAVLDLNRVVTNVEKMIGRLIGEDIVFELNLAPDLWPVNLDEAQVEQVIMNLAVNARDAMPAGGRLTLETSNVVLGEDYASTHVDMAPGPHVLLAMSDSGHGMDQETMDRIFDPFFTTKEFGKGTGLGLATVYGVVTQSGGSIGVYSEPGLGTTFKVYFPAAQEEELMAEHEPEPAAAVPRGDETVLVVEDEPEVRALEQRALEQLGYTVFVACNAHDAIAIAAEYDGPIHLIVTDVVMPHMSGRELAEKLARSRPETAVLYVSGYTDDAIVHHGVLEADAAFLQKPFTPTALAEKARAVLDQAD